MLYVTSLASTVVTNVKKRWVFGWHSCDYWGPPDFNVE